MGSSKLPPHSPCVSRRSQLGAGNLDNAPSATARSRRRKERTFAVLGPEASAEIERRDELIAELQRRIAELEQVGKSRP
jgi:hypothetical protein